MSNFVGIGMLMLLIFLNSSQHVFAQDSMSLEKAISLGLEKNFQIKIDDTNVQIAENNNTWGRAGRGVTVDLNGTANMSMTNDNNPASFLNGSYFVAGLGGSVDANWLVLSGGRIRVAKDQLDLRVEQQKQLQSVSAHNVIRDIIQSYYEVLLQQERLTVVEDLISLSQERLAYEESKKEFGASNSFNLLQFHDAVLSDSVNIVSQINQINIAKRRLYNLLSINADQNYLFPERLSVKVEDIDLDELSVLLEEESPTIRSLMILEELNQLNTQLEQAARKPTLSINATAGLSEGYFKFFGDNPQTGEPLKGQFSNRMNIAVGANLNWNLTDGGVRSANIENAKINEDISQLEIIEAKLQLTNQLHILAQNYEDQKVLLLLADQQISLSERNLMISEERFKLGQISSIDYRAIQSQYLNTAFNKVNAIYNLLISKSEIDWLVGVF